MIRASITYIAPSLSVTPLGPSTASVSYVAPVAAADSSETPVAAVSYRLITYGAVTADSLGKYDKIRETTVVADLAALVVSKVFSESAIATEGVVIDVASLTTAFKREFSDIAGATDDIFGETNIDDDQTMVFTKVTTDAATASENFVRVVAFSRTFTETPAASEVVFKAFGPAYSDGSVAGDAAAKAFNAARADNSVASDVAALLVGLPQDDDTQAADSSVWSLGKNVSESPVASEDVAKAVALSFSDSVSVADLVAIDEVVARAILDTVYATDDLDGETNIDDDQTMVFTKVRIDSSQVTDTPVKLFGLVRSDSASASEDVAKAVALSFSDSVSVADLAGVTGAVAKAILDTAGATDDIFGEANTGDDQTIVFTKVRIDSSQVTDTPVKLFGLVRSDSASASEDVAKAVALSFSDSVSVADLATVTEVVARAILDTAYATDDLDGETSIDDDQTMVFTKVRIDSSQVTDTPVKLLGPVRSDSASASDSGSLLSQGYVDNPYYFAEDYVGDSRTF